MGRIKAVDVDWLNEAWLISAALAEMHDSPPMPERGPGAGLLNIGPAPDVPVRRGKWKLAPVVETRLKLTLQALTLHLHYRLHVAHRVKMPTSLDGKRWFHDITDPIELLISWVSLRPTPSGSLLTGDDTALEAAFRVASVLKDRFCNPAWKREIPLIVAGVGGKSAGEHSRHIARMQRGQRSSRLADRLAVCIGRSPDATWKEVLDDLTGDGIVTDWDDECVQWLDDDDESQTTKTTTFRNLVTKAKKAK